MVSAQARSDARETGSSIQRIELFARALLSIAAVMGSLVATREGVGIDADSAAYLAAAQSLADGDGLTLPFTLFTDRYSPAEAAGFEGRLPLTHFPPLYPAAIALIATAGVDVELAARLLGAALLGVNLMLLGAVAAAVPNILVRLAVVVLGAIGPVAGDAIPTMVGRSWLVQHSQAMSEGLFTTFVLLTLLALRRHQRRPSPGTLVLVALPAALAFGTRYTGIAVIATAALVIGAWQRRPAWRRCLHALSFAAATAAPTLLWSIGISLTRGATPSRALRWPDRGARELLRVFEGWLGFGHWSPTLRHAALLAVVVCVIAALRRSRSSMFHVIAAFIGLSVVVVVITRAGIDASTPTDDRMFSPAHGVFYVLLIGSLSTALAPIVARRPWSPLRAIGIGIPVGLALAGVGPAWAVVRDGIPRREPPATVLAAGALPDGAFIATNVPTQLWEATRRGSILVPLRVVTTTDRPNASFAADVKELGRLICRLRGYVVLLGPEAGSFGTIRQANERDFAEHTSLRLLRREADGVILTASETCDAARPTITASQVGRVGAEGLEPPTSSL